MSRHVDQPVSDLVDRHIDSATDVVRNARLAVHRQQSVRLHDVTHVGEVATGIEPAHGDRVVAAALGLGYPRRECRRNETRRLSRTDVRERTGAHDIDSRTEMGLDADVLCCCLARGIGAQRKERRVFVDRQVAGLDPSVSVG